MSQPIENYALVGDTYTAALVGRDGSVDWLCWPRFDSGACFAALVGGPEHGRWLLAPPRDEIRAVRRRYREGTLILETEFVTPGGVVRVVDCMPPRDKVTDLVRLVEGVEGEVSMRMELTIRFDYGSIVPWVRKVNGELRAVAGPDALVLRTPVRTHGQNLTTVAEFTVRAGQRIPFVLEWYPSHEPPPMRVDAEEVVSQTQAWWHRWGRPFSYQGPYREAVLTSLVTLKALTYAPTGGIVAAPTTSLPEKIGGVRNWDYRYCWLRDATFTLYALTVAGFRREAEAWRDWLLRSIAGEPSRLQIMYGVAGERRLSESTLDWLPGYAGSTPVRVGNAAVHQLQLDVYGEVMDAIYQARRIGMMEEDSAWDLLTVLLDYLEGNWRQPDEGLWEVRGPRQHFTHSKVMAWVAFDRAVRMAERSPTDSTDGPVERWRKLRAEVHREVCERAYDAKRNTFTQAYESPHLDASLLLMPQVGFLSAKDPRMRGTVTAIERELLEDGLVRRYRAGDEDGTDDGLPGKEGSFLACSFWLADCYSLMGRHAEAEQLFEKLLTLRNDVGLLSEEYDSSARRLVGNFPQAFSHVGLVNTAVNLARTRHSPAEHRRHGG